MRNMVQKYGECYHVIVARGSSVVECQTRNQVSPGSNPPLLPSRKIGHFFHFTTPQSTQLYK